MFRIFIKNLFQFWYCPRRAFLVQSRYPSSSHHHAQRITWTTAVEPELKFRTLASPSKIFWLQRHSPDLNHYPFNQGHEHACFSTINIIATIHHVMKAFIISTHKKAHSKYEAIRLVHNVYAWNCICKPTHLRHKNRSRASPWEPIRWSLVWTKSTDKLT